MTNGDNSAKLVRIVLPSLPESRSVWGSYSRTAMLDYGLRCANAQRVADSNYIEQHAPSTNGDSWTILVPYELLHELWAHCDQTLETGVAASREAKELLQPFHNAIQGKAPPAPAAPTNLTKE